jgi:hypothetical protein
MADANVQLTAALNAIAVALANLNQPAPHVPAPPVLDPFSSAGPFDLASRAGSTAFASACAPLDDPWDGTVETFPSFIIALRIRSSKAHWNAADPQGILTIANHHLITHYHSITDAKITAAHTARADPRAIQNSRALYKCLKSSISGDLRATIFDQPSWELAHRRRWTDLVQEIDNLHHGGVVATFDDLFQEHPRIRSGQSPIQHPHH